MKWFKKGAHPARVFASSGLNLGGAPWSQCSQLQPLLLSRISLKRSLFRLKPYLASETQIIVTDKAAGFGEYLKNRKLKTRAIVC